MGKFPLEGWGESADARLVTASPTPSLPARMPDRALAAVYTLVCAVLLVASTLTDERTGAALRAVLGLLAVAALLRTVRRTSRIGTNPWLCLAAGVSFAVTAATVAGVARASDSTPPLWAVEHSTN